MFNRRKLTKREHKSRRVRGEPQIELNVCWKWYIYPGRKQLLDRVLTQAQQQLEEILCMPEGTIKTAEVREIGETKDRVLHKLDNIVMANRVVAADMQLPGFNDMLDGVMHRSHTKLKESIEDLKVDIDTQRKELESQRRDFELQLESQREELKDQRGQLEGQTEQLEGQRGRLESQRGRIENQERELEELKNRVKIHDEARDS